jgi:hypothetical protein
MTKTLTVETGAAATARLLNLAISVLEAVQLQKTPELLVAKDMNQIIQAFHQFELLFEEMEKGWMTKFVMMEIRIMATDPHLVDSERRTGFD